MKDRGPSRLRFAAWVAGGVIAAMLALAAVLFVGGDWLAATKLILFAFFGPAIAGCAALLVVAVRQPGWYRRPPDVAWVEGLSGVILLFVPILLYLPWAPNRISLDSMPFGLGVPVALGTVLVLSAAVSGIVIGFLSAVRRRDWGQLGFLMLVAVMIGWMLVRAIEARA